MTTKEQLNIQQHNVRVIFNRIYSGNVHIMTPHPIEYGVLDDNAYYIYELSHGTGIISKELFGVTILKWN